MEVMFYRDPNNFLKKRITAIFKDKNDLIKKGITFEGITYDDEWSVKYFLDYDKNLLKINEIIKDLEINSLVLNMRLKRLSSGYLKLILLIYSIINKKDNIVLDYFDKSLSFKYKRNIINYLKVNYKGNLIVISNDLVFLNMISNNIIVFKNNKIVFNNSFNNLYKSDVKIDYPTIIEFIKLANKGEAKLSYTVDSMELLKDIYRSVR